MISVHRITLDCANVPAVARFWSETLGGRIDPGTSSDDLSSRPPWLRQIRLSGASITLPS